jgi:hypothetical protein
MIMSLDATVLLTCLAFLALSVGLGLFGARLNK